MTLEAERRSADAKEGSRGMWSRVVAGIDGSPEGLEAARQAAALLDTDGELTLLSAYDVLHAFVGDTIGVTASARIDLDAQREAAAKALAHALETTTGAVGELEHGRAWEELMRAAERERAGVIAVGSHGTSRAAGIVIGSTATDLIHKAPCSVLVARSSDEDFPRSIVVGVDGSPESEHAYGVAADLSARFGVRLWNVVARGGKGVDAKRVADIIGYHREDIQDDPVHALLAAASEADLLVVGRRGLHGYRALGSVSERVAHRAKCSVLIVRRAPWEA